MYEVPIRVIGICKDKGEKKKRITGLEVTELGFKHQDDIIEEELACDYTIKKNNVRKLIKFKNKNDIPREFPKKFDFYKNMEK